MSMRIEMRVTMTNKSQTARILDRLKTKGRVTNAELNHIAFRYSARIAELRKEGHIIVTNRKGNDGLFEYIYKGQEA